MTEFIQVVTTVDTKERADTIARRLLEGRLAGCVQVAGPISSSYWWKGRLETAAEWFCVVKTSAGLYDEVEAAIRAVHTYEFPRSSRSRSRPAAGPTSTGCRGSWGLQKTSSRPAGSLCLRRGYGCGRLRALNLNYS
jgi:periplasmic divalent cation tolerance protein